MAPARRRTASGLPSSRDARSSSSGSSAPQPHDPAELVDPHHFAWWRRPADVALSGAHPSTRPVCGTPAPVRVEEDDDGITLVQERVPDAGNPGLFVARALGRFAGAELGDAALAGAGPAARAVAPRRARAAAGRRSPGPPSPTSPTTCGDTGTPTWHGSTQLPAGRPARRPGAGEPARPRRARTCWPSTGRHCGSGPGRRGPGLLRAVGARGLRALVDAYLGDLPAGLASRDAGRARGPGHRGVHRAHPRRVGAGPGRARRGCARREVPAPQRGAVPARPAAAVPADRGAAGVHPA